MPNITGREHPGDAGFHGQPAAAQMAELRGEVLEIGPGENESVIIQGEVPCSHSVCGWAPMKMKRYRESKVRCLPVADRSTTIRSRASVPSTPTMLAPAAPLCPGVLRSVPRGTPTCPRGGLPRAPPAALVPPCRPGKVRPARRTFHSRRRPPAAIRRAWPHGQWRRRRH
jgi:hypothetical protein